MTVFVVNLIKLANAACCARDQRVIWRQSALYFAVDLWCSPSVAARNIVSTSASSSAWCCDEPLSRRSATAYLARPTFSCKSSKNLDTHTSCRWFTSLCWALSGPSVPSNAAGSRCCAAAAAAVAAIVVVVLMLWLRLRLRLLFLQRTTLAGAN